jgi:hypothetical protein
MRRPSSARCCYLRGNGEGRITHVRHLADPCSHQSTDHSSPSNTGVPDCLLRIKVISIGLRWTMGATYSQRHFSSCVPETSHQRETRGDGSLENTENESRDENTCIVSVEDHGDNGKSPNERRDTQNPSGGVTTNQVGPGSLCW